MQGIHEGTGAMLLPVLLAATPPFPSSCATVYDPAPDGSMYPLHCHLLSSLLLYLLFQTF